MGNLGTDSDLQNLTETCELLFAYVDTMALKAAVELRVADIIHSHGVPLTLSQIASSLENCPNNSPNIPYLGRIMRMLVRKKVFTAGSNPSKGAGGETLYGLTHLSKWILHDSPYSLAPMLLLDTHPRLMEPWHYFSRCVREGGSATPFNKAHGCDLWDMVSRNPDTNKVFNDAMAHLVKIFMDTTLLKYKDGFASVRSLVDVGGGTGGAIGEIVRSYPHIKGINFDLPHVIAMAPERQGVTNIGGDMFQWVLHNWSDEQCTKILQNCKKAIPEKSGKVIIADIVMKPEGDGKLEDQKMALDLMMMAFTTGGKERTEQEWKELLQEGGFPRFNIIYIPGDKTSIIEAYPL